MCDWICDTRTHDRDDTENCDLAKDGFAFVDTLTNALQRSPDESGSIDLFSCELPPITTKKNTINIESPSP